jgi:6-phosphogluconate dehydrogenase
MIHSQNADRKDGRTKEVNMELAMIGLGRMGGQMTRRLLKAGHRVFVFDTIAATRDALAREGAVAAVSLQELTSKMTPPRAVWLMVPAGNPAEQVVTRLASVLSPGDIIIDGGNSNYKDTVRRAEMLTSRSISFVDVGTSGGVWGLREGYCLMVGGDPEAYRRIEPVLQTLAPSPTAGYGHVGPSGAGHFAKMVHNAIEYGLMEAYAEGFELLQAKKEFNFDLANVAEIWRYGSVIRSWLLDLTAAALRSTPGLKGIEPYVEDSGEGRWAAHEAVDLAVPIPSINQALEVRFRSRQTQAFAPKLLAALRNQFGGHAMRRAE